MARTLFETTPAMEVYWDDELSIVWAELTASNHGATEALENVDAIGRLRDHLGMKMLRVVVDIRKVQVISRQARTVYGGPHTASIQRATVLLTSSTISRVVANFFMGLNKPMSPTQMFTDLEAGMAWLDGFPNE